MITIDDYLPFAYGSLILERTNPNNNFWAQLFEKAYAKVNGNYDMVNYGWQSEALRFVTGAPTYMYYCSSYSASAMYAMVVSALGRGFNIGCDTGSSSGWNLPTSHAYAVLATYVVIDDAGASHNLLRVRNPWGIDEFSGTWCDSSSAWTTKTKSQVIYVNNPNDGAFYIEDKDFI